MCIAICDADCECSTDLTVEHCEDDNECSCDACYRSGFHCECGHATCQAPIGKGPEFNARAVRYYRYCLELESDCFEFSNFSPNEYLVELTKDD